VPGASKVWENCSLVSSTGDLNFCSALTMLCGTSSRLVHVTVEPAATAAIGDQAWLAENRAKNIATRERLTEGLSKLGFALIPSQSNFVWCTHPRHPAKPLYEQLKQNRILIRYMNYPGWSDGLRISVGTDEQIEALLTLLKTMV